MVSGRGRIGPICPSDAEVDADFWRYVPANVPLMITRLRHLNDKPVVTPESIRDSKDIENCALALMTSRAEAIPYAGTSASFQRAGLDPEIAKRIETATGRIPATNDRSEPRRVRLR